MSIDADISASLDLLGKNVGDLQEEIAVENGAVEGTLRYVTGYTGFSGDVAEQSGNYLALHAGTEESGVTITAQLIGGLHGPSTLDSDGIVICRVTSALQKIRFTAEKIGYRKTVKELMLNGLTLEES